MREDRHRKEVWQLDAHGRLVIDITERKAAAEKVGTLTCRNR